MPRRCRRTRIVDLLLVPVRSLRQSTVALPLITVAAVGAVDVGVVVVVVVTPVTVVVAVITAWLALPLWFRTTVLIHLRFLHPRLNPSMF